MRHGGREVVVDGMNSGLGRLMDVACVWSNLENSSHGCTANLAASFLHPGTKGGCILLVPTPGFA